MFFCYLPGEPLLLTKYHKSVGDKIERHPPGGVQHVHESGASHPDPGAPAGNTVCHFPLEAREQAGGGGLRVHHAHSHALPGGYLAAGRHKANQSFHESVRYGGSIQR